MILRIFTSFLSKRNKKKLILGSCLRVAPSPHNFNSVSCAEANLGVLQAKISDLRQKLVIICATRAGADLGVLAAKISVLRPNLVIICANRAGAN